VERTSLRQDDVDVALLYDGFTFNAVSWLESLGFCEPGGARDFIDEGRGIALGGRLPVNPSGGLLACGHPVGATGLMQAVTTFWQLQHSVGKHFGNDKLQVKDARRGLIHSHAGTGTYVTVSILERP